MDKKPSDRWTQEITALVLGLESRKIGCDLTV